ncbi:DUF3613 domain-containing protein [Ottowia sp. VDI28]|uniref:DUF3613 domain-containing protein n=1 Tax=Ottowia sp. VDI28 TaxID=3133968 RepID=UPI003C2DC212
MTTFVCTDRAEADQSANQAAVAAESSAALNASSSGPTTAEQVTAMPEHANGGRHIDIGAATGGLFAMQRQSTGVRPRPIDGEQARRSYQRYLKSFETTIPEFFDTGLGVKKQ